MTAGGDVVSSSAAIPAGIAPVVARSLWCFLWSFLCGDSIDDRSWRATQRGLERPRYKHTTLLYSLAVKVFEFPPSRRLVRVCRGKFVRSSEPSGDFALTGRSPRVSLLLDKLLSPKSLLSDSHPSVSKPSSVCYQGLITLEEGTITEGLIWFRVESYHVVAADGKIFWLSAAPT